MKKNLSYLVVLFCSSVLLAQSNKTDDFYMPVYQGCEKIKETDEQFACFQKSITSKYSNHLTNYMDAFEYLNLPNAEAEIILELTASGELNLKYIKSSSELFKEYCILAFGDFKKDLKKKKTKIEPAKRIDTNVPIAMQISFPVNFALKENIFEETPRLISVLSDNENFYDIYLTPQKNFKIYEVKDDKSFYLGKYSSLQEIKNTLPFKNYIENSEDLITLAISDYGKVKIVLQVLNVFKQHKFYTLFLVSEIKGKKIKQLRKYNSLNEFIKSPYYDWLLQQE